ncbi:hypothetical protein [Arthrobacter sp. SO3]|uniref:hypothetical protein n=1 Tax=Arthrobacter sp. SO3 TaxID=1897057 RepID=UPI001D000A2F|nr:hypothetical protein [Arthrobacter sp. SO3]
MPMATLLNVVAPAASLGAAEHAVELFRERMLVRKVKNTVGGSAHRLSHPLQRIQRDVNVLVNHPTLTLDPILEQAGRGLLGLGFTVAAF